LQKLTQMNKPQQKWIKMIDSNHYKDLVYMLVKRDFVSSFKQSVLGPVWFLLIPYLPQSPI
jgi:lipopolysaccharide transport system permease protein